MPAYRRARKRTPARREVESESQQRAGPQQHNRKEHSTRHSCTKEEILAQMQRPFKVQTVSAGNVTPDYGRLCRACHLKYHRAGNAWRTTILHQSRPPAKAKPKRSSRSFANHTGPHLSRRRWRSAEDSSRTNTRGRVHTKHKNARSKKL